MYSVAEHYRNEEIIKKSRFIGILSPCPSEANALRILAQLHNDYANASHITFAYRVQSADGLIYRFHDAGEPSGTAGKPIYQHLEGKHLLNVLLAVIRYFGGIKLGAGGLTRAYSNTAGNVIAKAALLAYIPKQQLQVTLDYAQLPNFEYQLKKHDGIILQHSFAQQVHLHLELPQAKVISLLQQSQITTYTIPKAL